MNRHVQIAEPSWRGHSLVYATNLANIITSMGCRVTLCIPQMTDENGAQIAVVHESARDGVEVRTCLRTFSTGFGKVLSDRCEEVVDSILEQHESLAPIRLILPTADAMVSMRMNTSQASRLRRIRPCSIIHQPRLGYGGYGVRFAVGREIVRARMRRCGHRLMTMDPLTHRSALRSGIEMGLLHVPMPDSERIDKSAARALLGIPRHARVIGVLGEHSDRKGTLEILRAWPKDMPEGMTLLILGQLSESIRSELAKRAGEISGNRIIVHDGFLTNERFQAGFMASDVITTLYPRHHGISGITVEAAGFLIPILGSDHGANGLMIRENGLGETVDARNPRVLRSALTRAAEEDPVVDESRRERFVARYEPGRFHEDLSQWLEISGGR
ncbi:MAG: hypothetical protein CMJ33_11120 [Phycisphaerae bacterium]|nr:hypothetical protein [Phycisphaerae bacterium]HAW96547.1 hypothetical protein [Phycisphaerales bacterium]